MAVGGVGGDARRPRACAGPPAASRARSRRRPPARRGAGARSRARRPGSPRPGRAPGAPRRSRRAATAAPSCARARRCPPTSPGWRRRIAPAILSNIPRTSAGRLAHGDPLHAEGGQRVQGVLVAGRRAGEPSSAWASSIEARARVRARSTPPASRTACSSGAAASADIPFSPRAARMRSRRAAAPRRPAGRAASASPPADRGPPTCRPPSRGRRSRGCRRQSGRRDRWPGRSGPSGPSSAGGTTPPTRAHQAMSEAVLRSMTSK